MKFEDVNEEEFIQKSLNTLANKVPEVKKEMNSQSMTFEQALSSMNSGGNYFEIKGLPSNNRLYPEGTKILGRPMKVIEVKQLASLGTGNTDFIINNLLKSCVKGIDIDNLYKADMFYILLWIRSNTFRDNRSVVNFDCDQCLKASTFHFDIEKDIDVQYLPDDYDPDTIIELPVSKAKIKRKFLTIGEDTKLTKFKQNNKKSLATFDDELLSMAQGITEINGVSITSLIEKYNFIATLDPLDYIMYKQYEDKNGMGLKQYMNVTCDTCGGQSQMAVTFHGSFMLPTYKI